MTGSMNAAGKKPETPKEAEGLKRNRKTQKEQKNLKGTERLGRSSKETGDKNDIQRIANALLCGG